MRDNFYNAFSIQSVQSQRIVIKTLGNIVKELKITHEENLCFTSRCLNKIDYRKFIDFFFALEMHSNTRSVALMLGKSQK